MNDNFTTVLFWKSYVMMTLILNYLKKEYFAFLNNNCCHTVCILGM